MHAGHIKGFVLAPGVFKRIASVALAMPLSDALEGDLGRVTRQQEMLVVH
ncbi:MAG: hypothetical protein ACE10E_15245 [Acidiferrobacterales bacterium]